MAKAELTRESIAKKFRVVAGEAIPPVKRIPTGNIGLDWITNGGIPRGRAIEIYGPKAACKSMTALFIHKAFANQGLHGAYHDAERTVNQRDVQNLELNTGLFELLKPTDAEESIDYLRVTAELATQIKETAEPGQYHSIHTIDTIATLYPKSMQKMIEDRLGDDAGVTSMVFKLAVFWSGVQGQVAQYIDDSEITLLMLNQAKKSIDPYSSERITTPGGDAIDFLASLRLQAQSNGKTNKESVNIPGLEKSRGVKWMCAKSKLGSAFREVELDYTVYGPDPYTALIRVAKQVGLIELKGANYFFSERFTQTHKALPSKIENGLVKTYAFFKDPANKEVYDLTYQILLAESQKERILVDLDEEDNNADN